MDPQKTIFLQETLPSSLAQLTADAQALWGLMTPQHMVEHLSGAFVMSLGRFNLSLQVAEKELPGRLDWMRSGKPFRKSVPAPGGQAGKLQPLRSGSLPEAIEVLMNARDKFYQFYQDESENRSAVHPYFGGLNGAEWEHFHYKHIYHHLSQFALLPERTELEALSI